MRRPKQERLNNKAFVYIEISFVLSEIANGMTIIEHSPHFGAQAEPVR